MSSYAIPVPRSKRRKRRRRKPDPREILIFFITIWCIFWMVTYASKFWSDIKPEDKATDIIQLVINYLLVSRFPGKLLSHAGWTYWSVTKKVWKECIVGKDIDG